MADSIATVTMLAMTAVIAASPAHAVIDLLYEEVRYDDTVVQCGALFKLVSVGYEDIGNAPKAQNYQTKFEGLLKQTEEELARSGRSKEAALKIYHDRSNHLAGLFEKDVDFLKRHLAFCDQKFPGK